MLTIILVGNSMHQLEDDSAAGEPPKSCKGAFLCTTNRRDAEGRNFSLFCKVQQVVEVVYCRCGINRLPKKQPLLEVVPKNEPLLCYSLCAHKSDELKEEPFIGGVFLYCGSCSTPRSWVRRSFWSRALSIS